MLYSLSQQFREIWKRNVSVHAQQAVTPECCVIARLKYAEKDFWIDGAVIALTPEGALFREASTYVLRRSNEDVVLDMEASEYPARIVRTDQRGHHIQFYEALSDELVADLCERWRIDA